MTTPEEMAEKARPRTCPVCGPACRCDAMRKGTVISWKRRPVPGDIVRVAWTLDPHRLVEDAGDGSVVVVDEWGHMSEIMFNEVVGALEVAIQSPRPKGLVGEVVVNSYPGEPGKVPAPKLSPKAHRLRMLEGEIATACVEMLIIAQRPPPHSVETVHEVAAMARRAAVAGSMLALTKLLPEGLFA